MGVCTRGTRVLVVALILVSGFLGSCTVQVAMGRMHKTAETSEENITERWTELLQREREETWQKEACESTIRGPTQESGGDAM